METQRTRPIYEALCKPARETDKEEVFPSYFSFPPRTGDYVRSHSGTIYRIVSIMHTAEIRQGKYGQIQSPKAVLGLEKV